MLVLRRSFEKIVHLATLGVTKEDPLQAIPARFFVVHHLLFYSQWLYVFRDQPPDIPENAETPVDRMSAEERRKRVAMLCGLYRTLARSAKNTASAAHATDLRRQALNMAYSRPSPEAPVITHTFFFVSKTQAFIPNGTLYVPHWKYADIARIGLPIAETTTGVGQFRLFFDLDATVTRSSNVSVLIRRILYEAACVLEVTRRKVCRTEDAPAWISYNLSIKPVEDKSGRIGSAWKVGCHIVFEAIAVGPSLGHDLKPFVSDAREQIEAAHSSWSFAYLDSSIAPQLYVRSESPLVRSMDPIDAFCVLQRTEPGAKPNQHLPSAYIDRAGTTGLATPGSKKFERRSIFPETNSCGLIIDVCTRGPYKYLHNHLGARVVQPYTGIHLKGIPNPAVPVARPRKSPSEELPGQAGKRRRKNMDASQGVERQLATLAMVSTRTAIMESLRKQSESVARLYESTEIYPVMYHAEIGGAPVVTGHLVSPSCIVQRMEHSSSSSYRCANFVLDPMNGVLKLMCGRVTRAVLDTGLKLSVE